MKVRRLASRLNLIVLLTLNRETQFLKQAR